MAHVVEHLSVAELEERYRAARDVTEARHLQAIWWLAQGRGGRAVDELAARYNAHGPDAIAKRSGPKGGIAEGRCRGGDQRRPGWAARVLTPALLAALTERLRAPPEDGGRWTGLNVALWMAGPLGVQPEAGWTGVERVQLQRRSQRFAGRGWEALKRVRWSPQTPRPRHPRSATSGERLRSTPEQRAEFKGGSTQPLSAFRPSTLAGRSRHRAVRAMRYQWLHVTAFMQPTSGEAAWFWSTGLSKPFFEALLAAFARDVGAGR